MYHRTSELSRVNDARKQLFSQSSGEYSSYIGCIETTHKAWPLPVLFLELCLSSNPRLPNPSDWGWTKQYSESFWTTLPEASKMIHCGCKKGCRGQCKCVKAMLKYTALSALFRRFRLRKYEFLFKDSTFSISLLSY